MGVPLGSYAFPNPGNSPNPITLPTYNTDTIVQRLGVATPTNPTVPLQMDALQLESTTPISLGGGPLGFYFVTLQSTDGTGPASTGSMTINWSNNTSGTFSSSLDVFFDVHFGALNGPIVLQSDEVLTNGQVGNPNNTNPDWSNLPEMYAVLNPNQPGNTYNNFLNGTSDANDFFATMGPGGSSGYGLADNPAVNESALLASHAVNDALMPEPGSMALLAVAGLLARVGPAGR